MYRCPAGLDFMYLAPWLSRYRAGRLSRSVLASGSSTAELFSYHPRVPCVTILTSPNRCSVRTKLQMASESDATLLSRSGCAASGSRRFFQLEVGNSVSSQSTRIRLCSPATKRSSFESTSAVPPLAPAASAASFAARLAAAFAFISSALRLAAAIFSACVSMLVP